MTRADASMSARQARFRTLPRALGVGLLFGVLVLGLTDAYDVFWGRASLAQHYGSVGRALVHVGIWLVVGLLWGTAMWHWHRAERQRSG